MSKVTKNKKEKRSWLSIVGELFLGVLWGVAPGAAWMFLVIVLMGVVGYVAMGYKNSSLDVFGLATVSGVLGGFAWAAGALGKKYGEKIERYLITAGTLYFLATIAFVIFGLYQPVGQANLESWKTILSWVLPISFYVGGIALALAMILSLSSIAVVLWTHLRPRRNDNTE